MLMPAERMAHGGKLTLLVMNVMDSNVYGTQKLLEVQRLSIYRA